MAFDPKYFERLSVLPTSADPNTLDSSVTQYGYKTTSDSVSTVSSSGYFDYFAGTNVSNLRLALNVGDFIFAACSDGSIILEVTSSGSTITTASATASGGSQTSYGDNFGSLVFGAGSAISHPHSLDGNMTTYLTANELMVFPIIVGQEQEFNRIGINVTYASATPGSTARLGIYDITSNGSPGNLILDAGTVAVDSTGTKEIVISETLHGKYYLAFIADSSFFDTTSNDVIAASGLLGLSSVLEDTVPSNLRATDASQHTALSNPAVSTLVASEIDNLVRVWVRYA